MKLSSTLVNFYGFNRFLDSFFETRMLIEHKGLASVFRHVADKKEAEDFLEELNIFIC